MRNNCFYKSDFFSLSLRQSDKQSQIGMQVLSSHLNTHHLPQTIPFLKKYRPSVLQSECFNEASLPFSKEAEATELGHLFEHLLLDQLCLLKVSNGAYCAEFSGRTHWNWKKDPRGFFRIEIDIGNDELPLFNLALKQTIILTEKLLRHQNLRTAFKPSAGQSSNST